MENSHEITPDNEIKDDVEITEDVKLTKKESFFTSLFSFVKRIFTKEEKEVVTATYSRFQRFLEFLERDDTMYENVVKAVSLCDEALRIARQRLILANRIKTIEENLLELDCFFRLNEDEAKTLKNLLDRFTSLIKERNVLMYQLVGFDKGVTRMNFLEEDAKKAVNGMQDAEKTQRILRQDIGYLEGEKGQLEHEKALLETGLIFVKRFALGCVLLFGLVSVYLAYIFMIEQSPIFVPTTILVLMTIVVCTLLYMFDKRMRYELKLNIKKQQKCVELLNKKNVVCAYYTNFLRFEYKKYKVRNTQMLQSDLKEFKSYKHVASRLDAIRKIMYETEKQIEKFLREKKITFSKYTIEQFAKTVNVSDKIEYSQELARDKAVLDANLLELDEKHAGIWELLEELSDKDTTEDKVISQMIDLYFNEVSNMLYIVDKEEEAV